MLEGSQGPRSWKIVLSYCADISDCEYALEEDTLSQYLLSLVFLSPP